MHQANPVVLALVLTALAASGCGSSKTGSTATTAASTTATATTPTVKTTTIKIASGTPLSRARWTVAGEAICRSTKAKLSTLNAHTRAEASRNFTLAADYYLAEAKDLAKLVPPKASTSDWERIVSDIQGYSEYTRSAFQAAASNQGTIPPSLLASAAKLQAEARTIAEHDGFKHCSYL
jgi:hypothetical protein